MNDRTDKLTLEEEGRVEMLLHDNYSRQRRNTRPRRSKPVKPGLMLGAICAVILMTAAMAALFWLCARHDRVIVPDKLSARQIEMIRTRP